MGQYIDSSNSSGGTDSTMEYKVCNEYVTSIMRKVLITSVHLVAP